MGLSSVFHDQPNPHPIPLPADTLVPEADGNYAAKGQGDCWLMEYILLWGCGEIRTSCFTPQR